MSIDRNLTTTSISIPQSLLERAKVRAALSYRTFSQYVSYLIDQDLNREAEEKQAAAVGLRGLTSVRDLRQSSVGEPLSEVEKNG
jgi:hypothetical protein